MEILLSAVLKFSFFVWNFAPDLSGVILYNEVWIRGVVYR